jgi:organic radical activating enzyme
MKTQSSTFCVLPWYSQEIFASDNNKIRKTYETPCCLLPKDYDITRIRNDLLGGIKTSDCAKCWDIESKGKTSRRLQENQTLDYKLNRDLAAIEQACKQDENSILLYQIYLSNLCNQACVTCNSESSTKWLELDKKMKIVSDRSYYKANLDELKINYAQARRINILGGEPLYDSKTFELLSLLADHNNFDCLVSVVTNGSCFLNKTQIDLLSKFNDVNICISIDGIESRFEYMRWPGKWEKLNKNIEQYRSIANSISVSYTISAVNAIYYDETVAWFDSMNLPFNHNIVYTPNWSMYSMPSAIKDHLRSHPFFESYCEINGNEMSSAEFLTLLKKQDQVKKIHLQTSMPELYKLLTD